MRKLNNIPVWRITLIIMGVVFITAHMSAGIYAKYASELGGTSTVSVAKFDGGSVSVLDDTYQISAVAKEGYHAFVSTSTITFADCEVSRQFTLTVKLPEGDGITFAYPNEEVYAIQEECNGSKLLDVSEDLGASFVPEAGKAYVGIKNGDGYTWSEAVVSADGKTLTAISNKQISMYAQTYEVKIVYFKSLSGVGEVHTEAPDIIYSLNCEQVD